MPVKNAGHYLTPCMESIIGQSFTSWELITVNDHSTDGSLAILHSFAQQDKRITVLQNVATGIIHALRLAREQARGKYITRMDADDLMDPDKIKLMVLLLEEHGKGNLALGLVNYFSDHELGLGYKKYAEWLNNLSQQQNNYNEIYKECTIPSPCWMVHRDDLERSGNFDSDFYPEDYDLAFRFRKAGLKVRTVNKVIHHWRDYPQRTSRTHQHYQDNRFTALKVGHFLDQDDRDDMPLILWGAGNKGKAIARELISHRRSFEWICNNYKKIGKDIFGVRLQSTILLEVLTASQVIVAISGKEDMRDINRMQELCPNHTYYSFC